MTPTREEKIAQIYEAMADKELSLGCVFVDKYHRDNDDALQYNTVIHLGDEIDGCRLVYYTADFARGSVQHKFAHYLRGERKEYRKTQKNEGDLRYEVIGHPIHIGVVLDWINNNVPDKEEINMIFSYRPQLSKPLPLNPTEERHPVIDFITSLLDQGTS